MPPTTPPAMAPTGVDEESCCEGGDVGEVAPTDADVRDNAPFETGEASCEADGVVVIGTDVDDTIVAGSFQD
jgi:hypothetical protein